MLLLALFSFLLLRITLEYIPIRYDVAFLMIKQHVIGIRHWRIAFFVHVFTSMFVLCAGFTQFSKTILKRYPRLHRIMGYIYVVDILLITGPASLIMSFYANGGFYSQLAFVLLAVLWWYCTLIALLKVRRRDIQAHRAFMIRSYALTLSAVTLRAWKFAIMHIAHPHPMEVYRAVAWLGWTVNIVIAELIIYRRMKKQFLRLI
jgi:uncharacterized membrane protein